MVNCFLLVQKASPRLSTLVEDLEMATTVFGNVVLENLVILIIQPTKEKKNYEEIHKALLQMDVVVDYYKTAKTDIKFALWDNLNPTKEMKMQLFSACKKIKGYTHSLFERSKEERRNKHKELVRKHFGKELDDQKMKLELLMDEKNELKAEFEKVSEKNAETRQLFEEEQERNRLEEEKAKKKIEELLEKKKKEEEMVEQFFREQEEKFEEMKIERQLQLEEDKVNAELQIQKMEEENARRDLERAKIREKEEKERMKFDELIRRKQKELSEKSRCIVF